MTFAGWTIPTGERAGSKPSGAGAAGGELAGMDTAPTGQPGQASAEALKRGPYGRLEPCQKPLPAELQIPEH